MSKVALITGASSGIGREIALYLSEKKFTVYGTSRTKKEKNSRFTFIILDVLDVNTIQKAVSYIIEKEGRLDVLINNAGMGITGSIEDTPTDEMRNAFNTNFFGAIDVMKAVLPQMRKQKSGTIINITSIAGYIGLPFRGVYSATKGALELMTEAIRMEVKNFGINVANIAPGYFSTNIASGRYYTPVLENSAYKEIYSKNLALMDENLDKGMHPIKVAKMVYKIIETKNPKIHYKVGGFTEMFSVILKRILPDKLYEKLIMNHYKL